jgi:hypothetical protein
LVSSAARVFRKGSDLGRGSFLRGRIWGEEKKRLIGVPALDTGERSPVEGVGA